MRPTDLNKTDINVTALEGILTKHHQKGFLAIKETSICLYGSQAPSKNMNG